MEKKYTKGPWKVFSHDADLCSVEQDNDGPLQVCGLKPLESCASIDWISDEQRSANANLIAAAPELLEMLEKITAEGRDYESRVGSKKISWLDDAESTIAKAHGIS